MSRAAADEVVFQTDEAWEALPEAQVRGLRRIDVREEARGLRFITSVRKIEDFLARHAGEFAPYTLYGSGDFHHLSAVWTRQFTEPFTILSFDNHPDWDIRPPHWSCGAWVNRALENPLVESVAIWGCGGFECNFPGRLLGNRRAAKAGRLRVHPWKQPGRNYPMWLTAVTPEDWRDFFIAWLETVAGRRVYITIDLDCLDSGLISTNWEQGLFTYNDIEWGIAQVRDKATIIGGDICGAWSKPHYASQFQRLAGWFDHPRIPIPDRAVQAEREKITVSRLWPALTGMSAANGL